MAEDQREPAGDAPAVPTGKPRADWGDQTTEIARDALREAATAAVKRRRRRLLPRLGR